MVRIIVAIVFSCVFTQSLFSQTFPNRTVRIVVPLPPGGSNDLVARIFSERLPF